jgi:hypothetical protein
MTCPRERKEGSANSKFEAGNEWGSRRRGSMKAERIASSCKVSARFKLQADGMVSRDVEWVRRE